MKSFESWIIDEIESVFEINHVRNHKLLVDWVNCEVTITDINRSFLDLYKEKLYNNANFWNEDELKMNFISPIIMLVDFITNKFKPFSQRSLSLKTDKVETSGIVDFMIATGKSRPQAPFMFLHEYKQQHPSKKNDPIGQLLIAMLAAQAKNENNFPVYGVLIEGRFWYFFILIDKQYMVSDAFDATTNDIYQIYSILYKVKEYINQLVTKN